MERHTKNESVPETLNTGTQSSTHSKHEDNHKPEEKQEGFFSEIIRFSVIALIIVIPIRIFIAQPFIVSGASMFPTFENGQYLIVDQVSYRFDEPERGDVIIFRYPRDPSTFFIKRVIALPGEKIQIDGRMVTIFNKEHPSGFVLDEFYINSMQPNEALSETLGENEYFVMGDNRDASADSRIWGVLQRNLIVGQAFLRLLPADLAGFHPGDVLPDEIEIIR